MISAGFLLVFVAGLRSFLLNAEGGTGVLATVVLGAGIVWTVINLVAQSIQHATTPRQLADAFTPAQS